MKMLQKKIIAFSHCTKKIAKKKSPFFRAKKSPFFDQKSPFFGVTFEIELNDFDKYQKVVNRLTVTVAPF